MEWWLFGSLMFLVFIACLVIGIPVAFSLGMVATVAVFFLFGTGGFQIIASTAYGVCTSFVMIAVPLFIFMGEIILASGISAQAFRAVDVWFGKVRGGSAVSSVVATTVFGAVTGFSPASCAAIGSISIPEMLKRNYDKGLSIGAVGGGACLAILIPPSLLMIIYGQLAGVSVAGLFYGGVVPGLIGSCFFIAYIVIRSTLNPSLVPWHTQVSWGERLKLSLHLLPLVLLILLVLGTIWSGMATPTEAAGLGAFGATCLLVARRRFDWATVSRLLNNTVKLTGMLFMILIAANIFTQILAYVGFTLNFGKLVGNLEVSRWVIMAGMQITIILLGCFIDPGSILFILTPIYVPIIVSLGFDPLWFGIVLMINLELATITPPVGLNLYVLKIIVGEKASFADIVKGVAPYWLLHLLLMMLVMLFPLLATWLPSLRPK
jgi:tripartite ATP-independent transporter DctM subunit